MAVGRTKGGRKGRTPGKTWQEKAVDKDVFEAEDSDPEEDRLKAKYDRVDNYEYELPEDFEDEEIDEDTAFTAEDEALFGHLFEDDRGGDDEDWSDDEDESAESGPEAEKRDELDGVFDTSSSEDEADGAGAHVDNDVSGDENEGLTSSDEDSDDDDAHAAMLASVTEGGKQQPRRKQRATVVTEAFPEAEHNMPVNDELSVGDLMEGLGTAQVQLGKARKALSRLTEREQPVQPPLPGPIQARLERKAGYEESKKDAAKWMPLVKANREAPTLRFTADRSATQQGGTLATLVDRHVPSTPMELEVAALLKRAGAHSDKALAEAENALVAKELSAEEVTERRNRLAKMRALLFYHETKARRLKKIKSKEYRRHLRRAEKRKAEKEAANGDLTDASAVAQDAESAEFLRIQERMSLKHHNTSRWARRALRRGATLTDDAARAAIAEQLIKGRELRRKVDRDTDSEDESDGADSASSTDTSDDEGDDGPSKSQREAMQVLAAGGAPEEGLGAMHQTLAGLPFMRRYLEKQRQETVRVAEQVLEQDDAGPAPPATRMAFGGGGKQGAAAPQPKQPVAGADDSDGAESDENEDVEAKTARLTRILQRDDELEEVAEEARERSRPAGTSRDASIAPAATERARDSGGFVTAAEPTGKASRGKKRGGGDAAVSKQAGAGTEKVVDRELSNSFSPAKTFQGSRPGFVFKKGSKGVGYYADDSQTPVKAAPVATAVAGSKTSKGSKVESSKKRERSAPQEAEEPVDGMRPGKKALTQDDLVRMAFAGDDVVAEFEAEKAADAGAELPEVEEIGVLPGWGTWAGSQREPAWMAAERKKNQQERAAALARRKDSKMKQVILSEKWDKKAAKYRASSVPYPFDSRETYERARRQPLGKEYNTDAAFRDLTRPAILKDAGVIIQPLSFSDGTADLARTRIKQTVRPAVSTVAGGRLESKTAAK